MFTPASEPLLNQCIRNELTNNYNLKDLLEVVIEKEKDVKKNSNMKSPLDLAL